jgi:hypothetical protein
VRGMCMSRPKRKAAEDAVIGGAHTEDFGMGRGKREFKTV